jgi:hypothetical protein
MRQNVTPPHPGPWTHRLLVYTFSLLFGLLVYWLLGFVVRDIGTWPGPSYDEVQRQMLDAPLLEELESLRLQIEETNRTITDFRQRQEVLRDSTANSERTMNQLLELQRLTLQKGMVSSAEEQQALAESQKLFLANQTRYQQINEQIATLSEQLRELERRQRDAQRVVDTRREPIQQEYQARYSRHQYLPGLRHGPLRGMRVLPCRPARPPANLHQVRRVPGTRVGKRLSPTPR